MEAANEENSARVAEQHPNTSLSHLVGHNADFSRSSSNLHRFINTNAVNSHLGGMGEEREDRDDDA